MFLKITKVVAKKTVRIDCESVSRTSGVKTLLLEQEFTVFSTIISFDRGTGNKHCRGLLPGLKMEEYGHGTLRTVLGKTRREV